ncbi:ATP-dependent (S)-NAD(P)H-hydrate dehydratase [Erysiphe necator]|nr:ATP-dependent (S)-NAD(P)H-hydrate dehydratase [Erysiphe necator]
MAEEYFIMNKVTRDLLLKVRKIVPPLLPKFHKGQMGRVAVIGGCKDYTGAPYFSAMATARLGADMSHVICEPQAGQVIKTYSPNLMVHPLMRESNQAGENDSASSLAEEIIKMLPRIHVLVLGPGLGEDKLMLDTCALVIEAARKRNMPCILDANALTLAQNRPDIIQDYSECILTPNVGEFRRLCRSKAIDSSRLSKQECSAELARAFGGVTVIQKGVFDFISNGERTIICDVKGGLKRSGGQGDTLTGCLATFLCWRKAYLDKLWNHDDEFDSSESLALAAFGGSAITRECSRLAFLNKGRSLQASDLTEEINNAFKNLYENFDLES